MAKLTDAEKKKLAKAKKAVAKMRATKMPGKKKTKKKTLAVTSNRRTRNAKSGR